MGRGDGGDGNAGFGGTTSDTNVGFGVGGSVPAAGGTGGTSALAASGTGASGSATAGAGGTSVMTEDLGCTPDGFRLGLGGYTTNYAIPPGACMLDTTYYCPGESYSITSGPCTGTCTCVDGGGWSCAYDHPDSHGDCKVTSCVVPNMGVFDVGGGWETGDGCTACHCSPQGIRCDSSYCDRKSRCSELDYEYSLALTAAERCDPTSPAAQCTQRFNSVLTCGFDVPVEDATEVTILAQLYVDDGCPQLYTTNSPRICTPLSPPGSAVECSAEGSCRAVP